MSLLWERFCILPKHVCYFYCRANSPPTFTVIPSDIRINDGQTIVLKASVDGTNYYGMYGIRSEFIIKLVNKDISVAQTNFLWTGYPKPTIQWLKDDEDLQESATCDVIEETTYSCLVIPNPTIEHAGDYICRAVNSEGICESFFTVTMEKSNWNIHNLKL